MTTNKIDWNVEAEKAAALTDEQLEITIKSYLDALDAADALDRATGEDRGGLMRDILSVLRSEQRSRAKRRFVTIKAEVGTREFDVLHDALQQYVDNHGDEEDLRPTEKRKVEAAERMMRELDAARAALAEVR